MQDLHFNSTYPTQETCATRDHADYTDAIPELEMLCRSDKVGNVWICLEIRTLESEVEMICTAVDDLYMIYR